MHMRHGSLPPAGIFEPERKQAFILAEISSGGVGVENPHCGGRQEG